jgi:DNA-binding PadR family transcriptional regulator
MIRYLLLGFLRDGVPRHGYALMKEAKSKLRLVASSGSVYRELRMLERRGLVALHEAGGDDGRRTSYVITDGGRRAFLAWLRTPAPDLRTTEDEISTRALFVHDACGADGDQLLERWQDRLWFACKVIEREHGDLIAACEDRAAIWIQELLLTRRLARVSADLEFLAALRARGGRGVSSAGASETSAAPVAPPSAAAGLPAPQRTVG